VPVNPPVVLLVDDYEDELAIYATRLLADVYQTIAVTNARDAFAHAVTNHPDVLVTDLMLSGVSGLDLIRRVRHDSRTKHLCIVVLTSLSTQDDERIARDAGCNHFIGKPCPPDDLARAISDALVSRLGASGLKPRQTAPPPSIL